MMRFFWALAGHGESPGRNSPTTAGRSQATPSLFGFYLQSAAGGIPLARPFWRLFLQIENVAAIKVAPFNRYQTIHVARALAESGRQGEVVLYTGNDDWIVSDLLTPFVYTVGERSVQVRFRGGLLGHWAVGTHTAVQIVERIKGIISSGLPVPVDILRLSAEITDANAAFFDVGKWFSRCIAGIHEVLVRQGLMAGRWCLRSPKIPPWARSRKTTV